MPTSTQSLIPCAVFKTAMPKDQLAQLTAASAVSLIAVMVCDAMLMFRSVLNGMPDEPDPPLPPLPPALPRPAPALPPLRPGCPSPLPSAALNALPFLPLEPPEPFEPLATSPFIAPPIDNCAAPESMR